MSCDGVRRGDTRRALSQCKNGALVADSNDLATTYPVQLTNPIAGKDDHDGHETFNEYWLDSDGYELNEVYQDWTHRIPEPIIIGPVGQ